MPRQPLVVGVGARRGVPPEEVLGLVLGTLEEAGLRAGDVTAVATLDARADEPGITGAAARLGVPVLAYPAGVLARVRVPHPSRVVRAAVATGSVAEAAALTGARGSGAEARGASDPAELLVRKRKSASATCAVARGVPSMGTPASTHGVAPFTMAPMLPPTEHIDSAEPDLRHHGDAEVRGLDLTDLAVNVRTGTPPGWLRERIAASLGSLAAYPDGGPAHAAVAARHGLPVERVLLTAGAAEAFVL
ncbi:cobalamin biosynthesis protein, partial [Streptomyces sp. NRRL WC-3549]|uniref:cobalamin biosynthesis protein n=1 Tax=Streptomyces sp. NRRL WC-3549 TaxID=1463925 RepID=UPI0018FE510A